MSEDHGSLRDRFKEMQVPCPDELPDDMCELVTRGLMEGRVLCITRREEEGKVVAEWGFLKLKHGGKPMIISDPLFPDPEDPEGGGEWHGNLPHWDP